MFNPPVDETCFICAAPIPLSNERVGQWLRPRTVCPSHKPQATLLSGERLDDFLARRADKTYPLEGSLLNYVINPVIIENKRGWCDFQFESVAILEEIFPSETYFDFCVQHLGAYLPLVYAVYQQRDQMGEANNWLNMLMSESIKPFLTVFARLVDIWRIQDAAARQPQRWSEVRSPDEAEAIARLVQAQNDNDTAFTPLLIFARLIELGKRRFAHLYCQRS